jgi:hypothetical protein
MKWALLLLTAAAWAQNSPRASLADQKACAVQAHVRLKEQDKYVVESVNHFDPKTGICYVGIRRGEFSPKRSWTTINVMDAFEGTSIASFEIEGPHTVMCVVGRTHCSTEQDFIALVEKVLGVRL